MKQFYKKEVYEQNYQLAKSLDYYCKSNKEELVNRFSHALGELLNKVTQQKDVPTAYIHFYVLRTDILFKNYRIWISAYNEAFYMDTTSVTVSFDAGELFTFLDKSDEYLSTAYKKYARKLTSDDVSVAVQTQAIGVIRYIAHLAKIATNHLYKSGVLGQIEMAETFVVSAGEYRDYSEPLYMRLADKKSSEDIKLMINLKQYKEFNHEDFSELELQNLELPNQSFCFTTFDSSDLSGTDMNTNALMGANFSKCKMSHINLMGAILHDADFENADLSHANLKKAVAGLTEPAIDMLYSLGFNGVNFRHSNLSGADLRGGNFTGADFRGASFENTNFINANLSKAIFDKDSISSIQLSKKQLHEIITV